MNRLFILLAAGLLGTGCVSGHDTCDVRTIRVDWHDNFLRADGRTEPCDFASSRSDPRVVGIDVFVNGQPYGPRVSCSADFVDIVGATPGDYDIIVEGLDAGGYIVSRDWFTVSASDSCGDILAKAQPAEGLLQLSYSFSDGVHPPTDTCVANSDLLFSITDTLVQGGQATYPANVAIPCSSGVIPLAYGSYRLDSLEEVSGATTESSACRLATAFDIGAATTTPVGPVPMAIGGPVCP